MILCKKKKILNFPKILQNYKKNQNFISTHFKYCCQCKIDIVFRGNKDD